MGNFPNKRFLGNNHTTTKISWKSKFFQKETKTRSARKKTLKVAGRSDNTFSKKIKWNAIQNPCTLYRFIFLAWFVLLLSLSLRIISAGNKVIPKCHFNELKIALKHYVTCTDLWLSTRFFAVKWQCENYLIFFSRVCVSLPHIFLVESLSVFSF